MATRPKTVREMQVEKKREAKQGEVQIINISKQLIKIHLRPPIVNGKQLDFFIGAQDINLTPNQMHIFKKGRLRMDQVNRLQKMRKISVVWDTDIDIQEESRGMEKVIMRRSKA
jgi:hypothetical protein